MAICSSYRAIYDRHRGPYSLLLSRLDTKKVKKEEKAVISTDKCRGPMSAQEAHETATMLVTDPRDNVTSVHVYSDTECQYIGAFYERGQDVPAWESFNAGIDDDDFGAGATGDAPDHGVEPTEDGEGPALLPPEREPLPGVDVPREPSEPKAPVRRPRVPAVPGPEGAGEAPPVRGGLRAPARKGVSLRIDLGNAERWPTSKGPALVRAWFEAEPDRQANVAEIVAAIGEALIEAGVQFPKSLVSRLKQGGFLKEVE